ncbi:MAG: rRNA ((1915)-N(3))-methyltransferase RlmH [Bacillota bacterium]|jgi:23S rRNA (pseudouridine1915-N3)-methyltransferase
MNIQFVVVGKLKEKYLIDGIKEYTKRMAPYAKVVITELADEKAPEQMSAAEEEQVRTREGERILATIKTEAHVIALAIQGETWTSEQFAAHMDKLATYGKSAVTFVIGGSIGLSDAVLKRANAHLSFGRLTYPHQLMRLLLVEQVYRTFKINRGEPYHK